MITVVMKLIFAARFGFKLSETTSLNHSFLMVKTIRIILASKGTVGIKRDKV